jgi:hypothetical protein
LGKFQPTNPPPGGGQIDQNELYIIDDFLMLSWASSQPQTGPQGAAKSVEVKCFSLRISCFLVGQVPSPKPAPRGREISQSEPFTIENFLLLSWASPRPQSGQIDKSELLIIDIFFCLVGKVPALRGRPKMKYIFSSTDLPKNERNFHFDRFGLQISRSEKNSY